MKLLEKTDEEILEIANPIWDDLVKYSNNKDYSGFTKHFSAQMLYGANEVEIGKQWANNKLLTSLSKQRKFFGCLRRNNFVTVLFKQTSDTVPGEFLGRLVLELKMIKLKSSVQQSSKHIFIDFYKVCVITNSLCFIRPSNFLLLFCYK